MSQQKALLGEPVGSKAEIADLSMHALDAFHGRTGVIIGFEQALRRSLGPDFEVGQIDIDQTVEQLERLHGIKRRCIVDYRQAQSQVLGVQYGQHNLRHHMLRRDQVDIVYLAHILQLHVPLGQLLRCRVEAVALVRDVVVLAEDAVEVAAGEEDGPGAVVPLYAGLLAEMGRDDVDFGGFGADEADAGLFPAVHSAASRAEVAVAKVGVGFCPLL